MVYRFLPTLQLIIFVIAVTRQFTHSCNVMMPRTDFNKSQANMKHCIFHFASMTIPSEMLTLCYLVKLKSSPDGSKPDSNVVWLIIIWRRGTSGKAWLNAHLSITEASSAWINQNIELRIFELNQTILINYQTNLFSISYTYVLKCNSLILILHPWPEMYL